MAATVQDPIQALEGGAVQEDPVERKLLTTVAGMADLAVAGEAERDQVAAAVVRVAGGGEREPTMRVAAMAPVVAGVEAIWLRPFWMTAAQVVCTAACRRLR